MMKDFKLLKPTYYFLEMKYVYSVQIKICWTCLWSLWDIIKLNKNSNKSKTRYFGDMERDI